MPISDNMHDDIESIVISDEVMQARIGELARAVNEDYAGKDLLLVGILKGAIVFMVDLARKLDRPLAIDFMAISSYGNSMESSGIVRILKDLDESITGRH